MKSTLMLRLFCITIAIGLSNVGCSQVLKHQPLWSQGEIPSEFLNQTKDVVAEVENGSDRIEFDLSAKLNINGLFKSGLVLFGDSVSQYVEGLANGIMASNGLSEKVKFYVLRSSLFNAFSSDQGYIFITTGAIAGVKSEEELIFIMCHELSHFLKKHNYESFQRMEILQNEKNQKVFDNKLIEYYQYSRNHELEADSLGVILYTKTGRDIHHILEAMKRLAPKERFMANFVWYPYYLQDSAFKFPRLYMEVDEFQTSKYVNLFSTSNRKSRLKIGEKSEEKDSVVDEGLFASHPDWKERLTKAEMLLGLDSAYIISTSHPNQSFEKVKDRCLWETLFYYMSSGNYVRAHYYCLELKQALGETDELFYYQTISLNNIYYKYFDGNGDSRLPTQLMQIEGRSGWNISHMFRFFTALTSNEWKLILVRENIKLKALFPVNRTVEHYLNTSLFYLKQNHNYNLNYFYKDSKVVDYVKDIEKEDERSDILGIEVITKKEIRELRSRYQHKAFVVFMLGKDSTLCRSVYNQSRQIVTDSAIYFSRSLDPYFTSWKRKVKVQRHRMDTVLSIGMHVDCFGTRKGKIIPTPLKNEENQLRLKDWQKEAAKKLSVELLSMQKIDKSSSDVQGWNNQFILNQWIAERIATNHNAIIPFFGSYLDRLNMQSANGLVMYTAAIIIDNGLKTNPFNFIGRIGNPPPRVTMLNMLANINTNEIILIQIESYRTRLTGDFGRVHSYDQLFEIKKAISYHDL